MKVLITGISLKSNTFSSLHTEYSDFLVYEDSTHLPEDVLEFSKNESIDLLPGFFAIAKTGGVLSLDVYNAFQGRIFESVRNSKFDCILLVLDGATVLNDFTPVEERLIKALRHYIGPVRPIAAIFNTWGNLRQQSFKGLNYATSNRDLTTYPSSETFRRSILALKHIYSSEMETTIFCKHIPLMLPSPTKIIDLSPFKGKIESLEQDSLVTTGLCCSIYSGFAWSDVPHTGVTVAACGKKEDPLLVECVENISDEIWKLRSNFTAEPELASLNTALTNLEERTGPIFLFDSGDDVTMGAAGNSVDILTQALKKELQNGLFAQYWDSDLVDFAIESGLGSTIPLQRLKIHDKLATVLDIKMLDNLNFVILDCQGNNLIIGERRFSLSTPEQFNKLGINLSDYQYCVFKLSDLGNDIRKLATETVYLDSKGASSKQLSNLKYKRLKRPCYPIDSQVVFS